MIAEAFEAAFEVSDGSGPSDLIEIGFAEVSIGQVLGEHVIGGDEDFVGDGERGAQCAATGLEAVELVLEIAALGSGRGDGGADQDGAQMDIALPGPAALVLAGALVIAGADAGPGGQMVDAEEHAHVDADLGDQDGGDHPVDPWDLHEQGMGDTIGFELDGDAFVKGRNILLGGFEAAQLRGQQEAVVLLHPSFERQNQIGPLAAQLPLGQIRHRFGRGGSSDQSLEHGASRDAEHVAGDAGQLDVGCLQELQEPVPFARLALDELAPIAEKLAQLPQRRRRHEALGDQAVPNQIGDPLGILHVGLAARHVTDMAGVADDEVEMPFQHGVDRAPINAGALHADLRHSELLQPVPQRFQIARHRTKGSHLLARPLARGADQDAGDDRLLMHVKSRAPLNDHLHLRLHPKGGDRDATGRVETLPRVLPVPGGDKEWYLYAARAGLLIGVASHRRDVSLNTIAGREALIKRPAPPTFSSIMARRRRWLAA